MFKKFLADISGASAIEYTLIAVLLSFAALSIINATGVRLGVIFSNVAALINP